MTGQPVHETSPLPAEAINAFQSSLHGELIRPGDAGYDWARQVWNAAIDRKPALIARCADTADVVAAVNFGRENGLRVSIRGGGHGVAGFAVADGGLMIDLTRFKGITVDPAAQTAQVEGGVLGKELGAATSPHGLALPLGQVPTTGVAGVLLGGGVGWLTRPYGLSCDHLLSAEVVTADGQVRTASATENPDLFWALRGGGGNFGVVTRMTVQLRPAGIIFGGMALYPIEQAGEALRFYRDFTASAPDNLSSSLIVMTVPPAPTMPQAYVGKKVVSINTCYVGAIPDGEAALRPLSQFGTPIAAQFGPMPFGALQSMGEPGGMLGLQHDTRSRYLSAISNAAIDVIIEHTATMPPPFTQVQLLHLGGAMARVPSDATAFAYRDRPFILTVLPGWATPEQAPALRGWTEAFAQALIPVSASGAFVNFLGDEGAARVREAYGANYTRLAVMKQQYDPTNFFQMNANIVPQGMEENPSPRFSPEAQSCSGANVPGCR